MADTYGILNGTVITPFLHQQEGGIFDLLITTPTIAGVGYSFECNINISGVSAEVSVISLQTRGSFAGVTNAPSSDVTSLQSYGSTELHAPTADVNITARGTHAAISLTGIVPVTSVNSLHSSGSISVNVKAPVASGNSRSTHGEVRIVLNTGKVEVSSLATEGSAVISCSVPKVAAGAIGTHGALTISNIVPEVDVSTSLTTGIAALTVPTPGANVDSMQASGNLTTDTPAPVTLVTSLNTSASVELEVTPPDLSITSRNSYGGLSLVVSNPISAPVSAYTTGSINASAPASKITMIWGLGTGGNVSIIVKKPLVTIEQDKDTTGVLATITPVVEISISTFVYNESYWPCLVLNTDTMLLSEYINYNFNTITQFGTQYLALGVDGNIYLLGGDVDVSSNINSRVQTGDDDLGSSNKKRVLDVVLGLRSDGDLKCSIQRDQSPGATVVVPTTGTKNIETRKVRTEKTKISRTFGVVMSNIDSSWFSLDSIELDVREVARRSGG